MKIIATRILVGLFLAGGLAEVWGANGLGTKLSSVTTGAAPVSSGKEVKMKEHQSGTWTPGLSDDEKRTLFAIARDTLAWCVNRAAGGTSNQPRNFPIESYPLTAKLKAKTATFVTLKIKGDLRGCIGSLAPVEPLYLSVHHNAINAAQEDPRFPPVRPAELTHIEIDVSILSPIRKIASLDEFKLGQMGIILEKGMHRSVFLPEVATEQGWTKEETLAHLSQKAGLPADAWKKDARFQVFESVVLALDGGQE